MLTNRFLSCKHFVKNFTICRQRNWLSSHKVEGKHLTELTLMFNAGLPMLFLQNRE